MASPITLTDQATPEIRRIAEQIANPIALYKDLGRRGANELKAHYLDMDVRHPNALGGTRTHFWLEIRDAVQQPELEAEGVSIAINHSAIAGKVFGATVTPKNAKALTIPIHELAHGRRASVFEDETGKKLFHPKGKNILMAEIGGDAVPIYALARRVDIEPDPEALPDQKKFAAALIATAEAHKKRVEARANA